MPLPRFRSYTRTGGFSTDAPPPRRLTAREQRRAVSRRERVWLTNYVRPERRERRAARADARAHRVYMDERVRQYAINARIRARRFVGARALREADRVGMMAEDVDWEPAEGEFRRNFEPHEYDREGREERLRMSDLNRHVDAFRSFFPEVFEPPQ